MPPSRDEGAGTIVFVAYASVSSCASAFGSVGMMSCSRVNGAGRRQRFQHGATEQRRRNGAASTGETNVRWVGLRSRPANTAGGGGEYKRERLDTACVRRRRRPWCRYAAPNERLLGRPVASVPRLLRVESFS